MSPDLLQLARDVMRAVSRRDADALVALAQPEVEWWSFFALGEGGAYRGHDGTRQYMRDLEDAFEVGDADVDQAIAVGDVVLLVGHIRYRGRGSGADGAVAALWVLTFRDGKVMRFQALRDPEGTLAGLGRAPG